MVHDGARPFPSKKLLDNLKDGLKDESVQGTIPATPVTDTLREIMADGETQVVDRNRFRAVQTPQAFRTDLLLDAYRQAGEGGPQYTDDASVMEAAGYDKLVLVEGDTANIKVTTPSDLIIANALYNK